MALRAALALALLPLAVACAADEEDRQSLFPDPPDGGSSSGSGPTERPDLGGTLTGSFAAEVGDFRDPEAPRGTASIAGSLEGRNFAFDVAFATVSATDELGDIVTLVFAENTGDPNTTVDELLGVGQLVVPLDVYEPNSAITVDNFLQDSGNAEVGEFVFFDVIDLEAERTELIVSAIGGTVTFTSAGRRDGESVVGDLTIDLGRTGYNTQCANACLGAAPAACQGCYDSANACRQQNRCEGDVACYEDNCAPAFETCIGDGSTGECSTEYFDCLGQC